MAEHRVRGVLENVAPGVGEAAPDFEIPAVIAGVRQTLRLSSYRGQKNVALAFYPFNWQSASATQLISYQTQRPCMLASNSEILAITVDSIMNTVAWEREIGPFDFPLCSDFWPHGEVSERYGVLRKGDQNSDETVGASERAVLVVDRSGNVVFRKSYQHDQIAPVEEILAVLEMI
jgi:peroxiredoxin (alkyl hydroperoxide reductase subunit C)